MTSTFYLPIAIATLLSIGGCEKESLDDHHTSSDTGEAEEEIVVANPSEDCTTQSLPVRPFDPEEPSLIQRHAPAGDFTVPLHDGTEWTLSEQWSGCDSYIFLPHWLPVDDLDSNSWWVNGIEGLIEKSPPNVHYFFVVAGSTEDPATADALASNIDEVLVPMSGPDRAWWANRLHVVNGPSDDLEGLVNRLFRTAIGTYGMAIDRFQKIRTLGSMAAVEAYDSALAAADMWPYERRIYEAGYQPEYYNFEADREARLEAEDALVIEVLGGDVVAGFEDGTLVLPDNIAEYDTLEIDVIMECPNPNGYELGNCGPWDYLAYMWLWEEFPVEDEAKSLDDHESDSTDDGSEGGDESAESEDEEETTDEATTTDSGESGESDSGSASVDTGETSGDTGSSGDTGADTGASEEPPPEPEPPTGRWIEMSRFITTYHRESRWVVDASHALAWLQEGGERTVRYEWAPSWNTQPTSVTTRFRFSKRDKPATVRSSADLFAGGGFNIAYNDREPMEVDIPADTAKVELVAIITGHGMDARNCAEFCAHSHHFTVNGTEFSRSFDEPGDQSGCAKTIGEGTVPNQAGTWWYGRGGWCPGQEVVPFVVDVTEQVTAGEAATVDYHAKLQGGDLIDGAGNIKMSSWLVFHQSSD